MWRIQDSSVSWSLCVLCGTALLCRCPVLVTLLSLSVCLSACLPVSLSLNLHARMYVCMFAYVVVSVSVCIHVSVCLSTCLAARLSIFCLNIFFAVESVCILVFPIYLHSHVCQCLPLVSHKCRPYSAFDATLLLKGRGGGQSIHIYSARSGSHPQHPHPR